MLPPRCIPDPQILLTRASIGSRCLGVRAVSAAPFQSMFRNTETDLVFDGEDACIQGTPHPVVVV